jgi:hypothetical protein
MLLDLWSASGHRRECIIGVAGQGRMLPLATDVYNVVVALPKENFGFFHLVT